MVAHNFETNGVPLPFVTSHPALDENDDIVSRAPCIGRPCILETNISLLPPLTVNTEVPHASRMLDLAKQRAVHIGNDAISHYLAHPPSQAVDGRAETFFQSPQGRHKWLGSLRHYASLNLELAGAQCGDWLSVDYFDNVIKQGKEEWILTVDEATMDSFQSGMFESSLDGVNWVRESCYLPQRSGSCICSLQPICRPPCNVKCNPISVGQRQSLLIDAAFALGISTRRRPAECFACGY